MFEQIIIIVKSDSDVITSIIILQYTCMGVRGNRPEANCKPGTEGLVHVSIVENFNFS